MTLSDGCTVILPTYNEEENIGNMITTLRSMYPKFHIVVMDDNSKDRTKEISESISKEDCMVQFFTRDVNDKGLSASIFQGIIETKTKFFINMDSDFQHPPSALRDIYERLNDGADLCIGIRDDRTALSFERWVSSWIAHAMAMYTLKIRGKRASRDIMSGLFGGKTEMFGKVIRENEPEFERVGFKALFDLMKYAPADIRIDEITFTFGKRRGGESKVSSKIIFSIMRQCGRLGKFVADVGESIRGN